MSEAVLVGEAIHVRIGGAPILRGVDVSIACGEVVGLFGPSGAGKTTLLRALAGDLIELEGRVRLAGEDVTKLALWARARRGLGYLPQAPSVLWDLTVDENLDVFAAIGRKRSRRDLAALAAELGLAARAGVKASALSGGERRRLELVRGLSIAPRVLLCDEPFAALDPIGVEAVKARLVSVARDGAAVVIADHHAALTLSICDRACLLLDGVIALDASARDVQKHRLFQDKYAGPGRVVAEAEPFSK